MLDAYIVLLSMEAKMNVALSKLKGVHMSQDSPEQSDKVRIHIIKIIRKLIASQDREKSQK